MRFVTKAAILGLAAIVATATYSNDIKRWYFNRQPDPHQPPTAQDEIDLAQFGAYYLGDVAQKELYLTFDEGYENGYTQVILDVLTEKNVPAAFFVTKTYIRDNPELIARMVAEGHVVGNHTIRHKSSPSLSKAEMAAELTGVADLFKEITGQDIPPFFRPPMGEYSEQVLAITQTEGYHTIFWSFAYQDWLKDRQPGASAAHKKVMDNLHNGAILLLHAVSSSNAEALGSIIDDARAQGYEFKSLWDLPNISSGGKLWNHLE
ncbi:MAG: delta-lactam-biosynthetic de-N-acetylase [Defluviitaleaceae bacterium]|nr:delta-lactam-biosynthetic de-N-acetylase [Defluviitaleaceae bacterium]